jgi:putative FmdB family regulatory protein
VPIYEYECDACHNRFELIQKFSDKPVKRCPKCGEPVHKVLSPPALVFKGTGWYVTDYASKDRKRAQKAEREGKSETKSDSSSSSSTTSTEPSKTSANGKKD